MITIYDSADMARVLSGPIDPDLKAILLGRLELLYPEFSEWDLADLAHFLVVEVDDYLEAIESELGISPFVNLVDETRFPDPAFEPSWEFCIARHGWFDLTFALCDSGLGICLLVPDCPEIEPTLLELCRAYATPAP
ncbi:MAG: hypothetical protein HEQ34_13095 [Sphingorhabdus sp.]|uniref:hypothetical protein n=1 Tax=Sphingorhabdus sp. TaxID=1902408 RepID=UPI0025CB8856|nr:hypothetical protein [Sphingorhabdus sp.]MCO4092869.1 hypothetical protein [Sphingorhabdus sp.]